MCTNTFKTEIQLCCKNVEKYVCASYFSSDGPDVAQLAVVVNRVAVLLLLVRSCLLLSLWGSVFVPCFVVHCFVSFLVLQSSG